MMGIVGVIVETQNFASLRSRIPIRHCISIRYRVPLRFHDPLHFPIHHWFWQFQLFRKYDLA